jgi:hypothetical protein
MPEPFGPDYTTDTRHIFIGDWVRVEGAQFIGVVRDLPASKPGFAEVAFGRLQEPYSIPLTSILEVRHA